MEQILLQLSCSACIYSNDYIYNVNRAWNYSTSLFLSHHNAVFRFSAMHNNFTCLMETIEYDVFDVSPLDGSVQL